MKAHAEDAAKLMDALHNNDGNETAAQGQAKMAVVKECFDSSSQDWRDDDCVQVEAGVAVRYLRKYDDVYLVVGLMQPDDMGKVEGLVPAHCVLMTSGGSSGDWSSLGSSEKAATEDTEETAISTEQTEAPKKTRFSKAGKGMLGTLDKARKKTAEAADRAKREASKGVQVARDSVSK